MSSSGCSVSYALWNQLSEAPLALRATVVGAILLVTTALTLLRPRGRPLEEWLLAACAYAAVPRSATWRPREPDPGDWRPASRRLARAHARSDLGRRGRAMTHASVQEIRLGIAAIGDDVVRLANGEHRAVLEVTGTASPIEDDARAGVGPGRLCCLPERAELPDPDRRARSAGRPRALRRDARGTCAPGATGRAASPGARPRAVRAGAWRGNARCSSVASLWSCRPRPHRARACAAGGVVERRARWKPNGRPLGAS